MKRTKKQLIVKHDFLEREIQTLSEENRVLKLHSKIMEEQIQSLKDGLWKKKREKLIKPLVSKQANPTLPWEAGLTPEDHAAVPVETEVKKPKKKRKEHEYAKFLDGLERVEEEFDLTNEEKKNLIYEGEDKIEVLACKPAKYYVKVKVIKKYTVANHPEAGVIKASLPESAIPGSSVDESFYSMLLVKKYCDHLPLYRLEGIFDREGLIFSRQSMSKIVIRLSKVLKPIAELLKEAILSTNRIFADETTVDLLQLEKCKQSYFWAICASDEACRKLKPNAHANPPLVYYEFADNRRHENIQNIVGDYKGKIHSDAYQAYENMITDNGLIWQPCWAHARRKFFESKTTDPIRIEVIELMDKLFEEERIAWAIDLNEELTEKEKLTKRYSYRQANSLPLVDVIFQKIETFHKSMNWLPKEKIVEAAKYMTTREKQFRNFLDYADLRIDNNPCERNMRPIAIGRKNWMFVGSADGGEAAAIINSLIQTCRNLNINPQDYLEDLLRRINNTPEQDLVTLLPQNWLR
jgi:transposase